MYFIERLKHLRQHTRGFNKAPSPLIEVFQRVQITLKTPVENQGEEECNPNDGYIEKAKSTKISKPELKKKGDFGWGFPYKTIPLGGGKFPTKAGTLGLKPRCHSPRQIEDFSVVVHSQPWHKTVHLWAKAPKFRKLHECKLSNSNMADWRNSPFWKHHRRCGFSTP